MVQGHAQQTGEDHRRLLAGGLPADKKAFAARSGYFGQVHRHPAKLDARRETLQQAAEQHEQRCRDTQGGVSRDAGYQYGAGSHHHQGNDQAFATPVTVDVGAEKDCPQRPHQEAGAEGRQRQHQGRERAVGGEEGFGDGGGVEAVDHEVEHFEEVAADNAKDRFAFARGGRHV